MTEELKSCPMCEGLADYVGREGQGYWVECKHCLTRGPWGDYGYQAKDGWNKRTSPPPPSLHREPVKAEVVATCERLASRMGGKYVLRTAGGFRPAADDVGAGV